MRRLVNLSEEKIQEIEGKVPGEITNEITGWLRATNPVDVAQMTGPNSKLSMADVCLLDTANMLWAVVYALRQSLIHLCWYREECPDSPREDMARSFAEYYVDDAAIRLYTAAEHLANFIKYFLAIDGEDLESRCEKNTSTASKIGKFLKKKKPDLDITQLIEDLVNDDDWHKTRERRNLLVHEQPELVIGAGNFYDRKPIWKNVHNEVFQMGIGANYEKEATITIDELIDRTLRATKNFEELLSALTEMFYLQLETFGIKRDFDKGEIKFDSGNL
jgi:hypothetical protein